MLSTKKRKSEKVISFPVSVFETAHTKEDLEDWILAQNRGFLKKMKKARQDDLEGKGKDWKQLKKELCIKKSMKSSIEAKITVP